MRRQKKQLLGLSGLLLVAATTFVAHGLPPVQVYAESGNQQSDLRVQVTGNLPVVRIAKPQNNATIKGKVEFRVEHVRVQNATYKLVDAGGTEVALPHQTFTPTGDVQADEFVMENMEVDKTYKLTVNAVATNGQPLVDTVTFTVKKKQSGGGGGGYTGGGNTGNNDGNNGNGNEGNDNGNTPFNPSNPTSPFNPSNPSSPYSPNYDPDNNGGGNNGGGNNGTDPEKTDPKDPFSPFKPYDPKDPNNPNPKDPYNPFDPFAEGGNGNSNGQNGNNGGGNNNDGKGSGGPFDPSNPNSPLNPNNPNSPLNPNYPLKPFNPLAPDYKHNPVNPKIKGADKKTGNPIIEAKIKGQTCLVKVQAFQLPNQQRLFNPPMAFKIKDGMTQAKFMLDFASNGAVKGTYRIATASFQKDSKGNCTLLNPLVSVMDVEYDGSKIKVPNTGVLSFINSNVARGDLMITSIGAFMAVAGVSLVVINKNRRNRKVRR